MSDVLVTALREKTEEEDLNSILKPCIGGYTKQSVQEYLAYVKSEQQNAREAYEADVRRLKGEIESLRAAKAALEEENLALSDRLEDMLARPVEAVCEAAAPQEAMCEEAEEVPAEEVSEQPAAVSTVLQFPGLKTVPDYTVPESDMQAVPTTADPMPSDDTDVSETSLPEFPDFANRFASLMGNSRLLQDEIAVLKQAITDKDARIADQNTQITELDAQIAVLRQREVSNHRMLDQIQAELAKCIEQAEWNEGGI